jgi:glycosyltransferase involved in cell wall biosynthesis
METKPKASVIIPTFNRKKNLIKTLTSLREQKLPYDFFEVIIVDDGSTDGTNAVQYIDYPFNLRYLWQTNQGDAAARNLGAQESRADILIFLDDDIIVDRDYLPNLLDVHKFVSKSIVVGSALLWLENINQWVTAFNTLPTSEIHLRYIEIQFTDVLSNNMSIHRDSYFSVGMMDGLDFPGSSIWCDVDFAYRAYRNGYKFYRSTKAKCWHKDYTMQSLDSYKKRMRDASFRSVALFQKYPELISYLPMFNDKTPISWVQDPTGLIARKLARRIMASNLPLQTMESIVDLLEKFFPSSFFVFVMSRWIIGGHIFQGYSEGLRVNGSGNQNLYH